MKKLFILAAAIVAFASCSKEPETIVNDGSIKFMSAQTRHQAGESTIANLKTDGFTVYGYTANYDVFAPAKATDTDNDGTWTTDVTKYWADNQVYDFVAFYAQASNSITSSKNDRTVTVNYTLDGVTDFIAAYATTNTNDHNLAKDAVQLNFGHQLERVAFKFVNKFDVDERNFSVTVTDVKLNGVPSKAVYKYVNGLDVICTPSTDDADKMNLDFEFADGANVINPNTDGNAEAQTYYCLIIPTTSVATYNFTCTVVVKDLDNNGEVIKTFNVSQNITPESTVTKYEAGQSYVFTANVYSLVNPIEFTVDVAKWGVDTPAGTITIGDEKK